MKKGDKQKPRICVEYKGGELILKPGEIVFELDCKTGIVSEYKLIKKKKPIIKTLLRAIMKERIGTSDNRTTYIVEDKNPEEFLHVPATSKFHSIPKFKQLLKIMGSNIRPH